MNVDLAVIADDITGAADTGVKFLGSFDPIYLLNHLAAEKQHFELSPGAISIFTNSRGLSIPETRSILQRTIRRLQTLQPQWIYKKIDSCMRGAVGFECSLLVSRLQMRACFVAPASPVQGRTTVHDIHRIHGKPVAETEIGRDPVCPVKESRLTELLSANHRHKVAHVEITLLEESAEALAAEVSQLIESGNRLIAFDAITEEHLQRIVELALTRFPGVLLAGSAGLASVMAEQLCKNRGQRQSIQPDRHSRNSGNLLLVCGSASEILQEQVRKLQNRYPCKTIMLEPEILADPEAQALRENSASKAAHNLIKQCLVVQISPFVQKPRHRAGPLLLRGLGEFVCRLIELCTPSALFLSGGDTAAAVLNRLNPYPIRLEKEIEDGVVATAALKGPLAGRTIVMKAGALGSPRSLVELYRCCYEQGDKSEE